MTTRQLAKQLAKGNGNTVEEELDILEQRQRDISLHGYAYAFKHSVMTYEKAEWLKKNNKLRGEM